MDGLGDGQVDTSGVVDAELVEEAEPVQECRTEVGVSVRVRVAVLAVPPGDVNVPLSPAPTPTAGPFFIRLGHGGLLISRMSRSAPGGRSTITTQLFIDYANLSMIRDSPLVGAKAGNKSADLHHRKGLIKFTGRNGCLL